MSQGRVLSIQSHVVHGYVGNRAAVFPLQLLGFEVDFINSVQFSNHVGYGQLRGDKFNADQLNQLYTGLKLNNLTSSYTHLLTGYCGDASFLNKIADIVEDLKQQNPNLIYLCDPVLGDNGKWYVPQELLEIFKKRLLTKADIITPNLFELEKIYGKSIESNADIYQAIKYCHREFGIKKIILSSCRSFDEPESAAKLNLFASSISEQDRVIKIEFDSLPGHYSGTGDTFAAMLLAWLSRFGNDLKKACEYASSAMQHIIRRTLNYAQEPANASRSPVELAELRLIESKRDIEEPQLITQAQIVFVNQN